MKVLSIDPGYDRLGIAVIERDKKETLLFSDCITSNSKDDFSERLRNILEEVEKVIGKYTPDHIALETLFMSTNQKTAMRVAEVRGALIYAVVKRGIPVFEYTPLQVKSAIAGYGKGSKGQIMAMVPQLIDLGGRKIRYDDEYDAIAIGLTHLAIYKN